MVRFGYSEAYHTGIYDGENDPTEHLTKCQTLWASRPRDEWVHAFVHTLEEMPRSWYVAVELHRTITTWEELFVCFGPTFSFQDINPKVCNSLQIICDVVLKVTPVTYPVDPHAHCSIQSMMACYNLLGEPKDDDELRNVNILESKGIRGVAALDIPTESMNQPLRIQKVDIGMIENPKFANVRVYWGKETMAKITDLLHEFHDLFPT